jgi:drug/metabolite transporter (DMT)-like permease
MSGILLALISALGFGLFQVLYRYSTEDLDSFSSTFFVLLVNAVFLGAIRLLTAGVGSLTTVPPVAAAHFTLAGFIHFSVGWTLLNQSQKRLGAARTGALVGTTPLFAAVVSLFALDEHLGMITSFGIVLVVVGVIVIMSDQEIQSVYGGVEAGTRGIGWRDSIYGVGTALAWSFSPIFIRKGLAILPSPLTGLTIGMAVNALGVGVVLALARRRLPLLNSPGGKPAWQVVSGMVVMTAVWTQWAAYDLIEVAVVLALARLNIPVILLLAPIVIGHPIERVSARVWLGGLGIVVGTLILILF